MQLRHTLALGALVGSPVLAADLTVGIEVPRLNVAEYHRPYVATWIEAVDSRAVTNLAVWYDVKMRNDEGTKWLKDMRQWWRKGGRELKVPVDGVTSATRPVGKHALRFSEGKSPLTSLAPGAYRLVVEAAREVGGRELLSIPFQWPPTAATTLKAQGSTELGEITLDLKP